MAKCSCCGSNKATLLCDFVLGFSIIGWTPCTSMAAYNVNRIEEYVPGKGLPYIGSGSEMYTCDAPICEACVKHTSLIFFDGDKKHTAIDSVDICQLHNRGEHTRSPCMTAEQAENLRWQLWKRPRLKLVGEKVCSAAPATHPAAK